MRSRARTRGTRRGVLACVAIAATTVTTEVDAADVRTISRTIGEGYMVRAPGPEATLLTRRRVVQYVGVGVYRILPPKRPDELVRAADDGQLQIVTSMRVRHDFGRFTREASGSAARLVDAIDNRQIDLLYAYLEGQNIVGHLDFKLGRQFEMSGLDFYAFDGGWLRARTPAHLAVEAFGGFAVDASDIFGFPTFELDGTADDTTDRITTPMVGAAFAMTDVKFMDARFAYRRSWSPASFGDELLGPDGTLGLPRAIDQELVTGTVALRLADGKLMPTAAMRYNLGTARLDDTALGVSWAMTEMHTLRAQYLRTIPAFDLDSIFNVFAIEPIEDVRVGYEVRPGPYWTLYGRFQGRIFRNDTTAALATDPERPTTFGGGGAAGAGYRRRRFAARADLYGLGGEGGRRLGGNLDTRTHVVYDRLALDGRLFLLGYDDDLDPARRGYSVAMQAGGNVRLGHGLYLNVVGEQMFTTFYRTAFRAFAVLSFDWAVRGGRR